MLLTVDLERLEIAPGQLLLDAGCGEGRHCFGALDRGANVVGLDLDLPSMAPHTGRLNDTLSKKDAPTRCRNDASWLGAGESGDDELEEAKVHTAADGWGDFGPRPARREARERARGPRTCR